jgi:hypothetical protein
MNKLFLSHPTVTVCFYDPLFTLSRELNEVFPLQDLSWKMFFEFFWLLRPNSIADWNKIPLMWLV